MNNPFTNDDDELNMNLSKALELTDPLTDLEIEMTEEIAEVKKAKKVGKKIEAPAEVKAKTKAVKEAKAPAGNAREIPEGYVGLTGLATELHMDPAALRRKLRTMEGVEKPEGSFGWRWKEGSRDLTKLRKELAKG